MTRYKEFLVPLSILAVAALCVLTKVVFRQVTTPQIISGLLIYTALALLIYLTLLATQVNVIARELRNLMHLQAENRDLIVTLSEVASIEKELSDAEIWVLTCDLSWDLEGSFWKIVKENIHKRGNRYVYFYPEGELHRYAELLRRLDVETLGSADRVASRPLADNQETLISHYVLYHPHDAGRRRAFMLTPRAEHGLAISLDAAKSTELQQKLARIDRKAQS